MVKMLTAYTNEMDDVDLAVTEILEQLDLANNQAAHSVGIVSCHQEYLETGVLDALVDRLDFDIVGCTTLGNGIDTASGINMLCLSVLTGDDVFFSTGYTSSIAGDLDTPVKEAYADAAAALQDEAKLIVAFLPVLSEFGGERRAQTLFQLAGNVPVFGTIACDHTLDFSQSYTFRNHESAKDCMGFVMISGNVSPKFWVRTISEDRINKQHAIITASEGSLLKEVNGMPVITYLETLGLTRHGGIESITIVPLYVDYGDGSKPAARAIYMFTPEGHAVCGSDMPVGATLSIGSMTYEDVINTTQTAIAQIVSSKPEGALLVFPCLSRSLVLNMELLAELDAMRSAAGDQWRYLAAYSGGELCPQLDGGQHIVNRFHNFSLVVCSL